MSIAAMLATTVCATSVLAAFVLLFGLARTADDGRD